MAGLYRRFQGKDIASQQASRQDRNLFLSDGGTWTWNKTTGVLTWSGVIRVSLGFVPTPCTINAASATLSSTGDGVYIVVDRTNGGAATAQVRNVASAANNADNIVYLGVRGADGNVYLMDGTVMFDGDSKVLGTLKTATDRATVNANGVALQTVPFSYVVGSKQLAVFVGGWLQELGTHYTETSGTQITFVTDSIPGSGERITYLNVIGGQGPAGTPTLQGAYNNGPSIDTSILGSVTVQGTGTNTVLQAGTSGTPTLFQVMADGSLRHKVSRSFDNGAGGESWRELVEGSNYTLYNLTSGKATQFSRDGGMSFGTYQLPNGPFVGNGTLQWMEISGTFSSAGVTQVNTGLTSAYIKAVLVRAVKADGTVVFGENSGGNDSTLALYITLSGSTVRLSGNSGVTTAVGSTFWNQPFNLIIFYGP